MGQMTPFLVQNGSNWAVNGGYINIVSESCTKTINSITNEVKHSRLTIVYVIVIVMLLSFCENSIVREICDRLEERGWGAEMSFEDARLESEAGEVIKEMGVTIESYIRCLIYICSRSGVCRVLCRR